MNAAVKRDIRLINTAGVLGTLYVRLTIGEILLLFITQCLGIPKEQWALAAAIIPLTSVLHLVSGVVTEHLGHRKVISLTCFAVGRLATPFITLVPVFMAGADPNARLFFVATALIAQRCFNAVGTSAWMSWIADVVPQEERGRYYSMRLALNTAVSIAVLLGAGWLIDQFDKADPLGYALVFAFAFAVGELDLLIHSRVADRPMPERKKRPNLYHLAAAPWRHKGFRNLMLFRVMNVFGNSLTGPFALMYLYEELQLTVAQITILTSVVMGVQSVSFSLWRRIGERIGYRNAIRFCGTLSGVGVIYWWFLVPDNHAVLYAVLILARIYFGILAAGQMLANSTLQMNVAPEENRSMYFAQINVIIAVTMSAAILCGRWLFMNLNPDTPVILPWVGTKLTGVHVLLGLVGLFRIAAVRLFHDKIPEVRGAAVLPRINRIMRTNALRIFPTVLPLERPLSQEERARHIESMKQHIPTPREAELEEPLKRVLKDELAEEEEFHHIIEQVRSDRASSIERMMNPIGESAALHRKPAKAKAEANHITQLYAEGDLGACLRAVQRLAHKTADTWESEKADAAVAVIDGLVENVPEGHEPHEQAVLLAIYSYLQIVREPEELSQNGTGADTPLPDFHEADTDASAEEYGEE